MTSHFEHYLLNTVNYDFLNKFAYEKISKIPTLLNVTLHFTFKFYNFKLLIMSLVVLEILTGKKGSVMKSKTSNISVKLRKGSPIGCKVVLRKKESVKFLSILFDNYKSVKCAKRAILHKDGLSLSTVITNVLTLPELENNYHFFKNLGSLNVKFVTTATTQNELNFLLKSCKLQK